MPSLKDVLKGLTGFDDEAIGRIMKDVFENNQRLKSCALPHDFQPVPPPQGYSLPRDFKCTKCEGTVSAANARWYKDGVEHAKMRSK